MSKKQVWVSPNPKGGWRVHDPKSSRDSAHIANRQEAIECARKIARDQAGELMIQKRDGKISERNTYGRDPFPPKG